MLPATPANMYAAWRDNGPYAWNKTHQDASVLVSSMVERRPLQGAR
ncbi:hypothetical protein Pecwa_1655 [Pectobacterium parmentieri WPP163]|nr:hypothetical protein Pecwa_1655 [Pectobacterium parmentieri WPP163]